jgi:tRNA U34 5-carboxymethylaminomethyl modifying GTPase MnmE/TrmE
VVDPRTRLELLTPRGAGGIAVLAVRGDDRHGVVAPLLRRPDRTALAPEACVRPTRALLWLAGGPLDEVLVVDRPQHATFEIHCHGAEAVLAALGDAVVTRAPADPAERLCREALSDTQLALALEQRAVPWADFVGALRELPAALRRERVAAARARSVVARALAEPAVAVLCGAQNAGKSTLMNRLLCRDRVLTGELPGLTRDPVRERTVLGGYPYELVDTAGEGSVALDVDHRALELARAERARAGVLRILVVDGQRAPGPLERELHRERTLAVRTKVDLPGADFAWPEWLAPAVAVSCLEPADAPLVRARVGEALRALRALPPAGPVGGPAALSAAQEAELDALA